MLAEGSSWFLIVDLGSTCISMVGMPMSVNRFFFNPGSIIFYRIICGDRSRGSKSSRSHSQCPNLQVSFTKGTVG
ncbi:hypothetical protein F2Q68_00014778 [Brassica cretica]|uniref:Uncharacterized protein n=1 Tax=Brassica cretica TaxID=69181 RepID=A0A8S9HEC4_BRACR|nr:hypothetical protein F2Q68_00014778 [Brassica cretica]